MQKILFIIFSAIVFCSCKHTVDFSKELILADSLKTDLKKTAEEFCKLDSEKISGASGIVSVYISFISEHLRDTISQADASIISNFKSIAQTTAKYNRTKKELNNYYLFNLTQLENLIYDLKNGIIVNKDSSIKYLISEQSSNAELISMMKLHIKILPSQIKLYDSLKPQIENFIKNMNNGILPNYLEKEAKDQVNANEAEND